MNNMLTVFSPQECFVSFGCKWTAESGPEELDLVCWSCMDGLFNLSNVQICAVHSYIILFMPECYTAW